MIGIAGYATLRGIVGPARVWMEGWSMVDLKGHGFTSQALPDLLGGSATVRWVLALAIPAALLVWVFKAARFRRQPLLIMAGQIGRAHVLPPVNNAHLVCRLLLENK